MHFLHNLDYNPDYVGKSKSNFLLIKRMYEADDVQEGAIGRDIMEMVYETRTSSSRQTENLRRKSFWTDVPTPQKFP